MRKILTISIPDDLEKEIDTLAKEENSSKSEIMRNAIKDYIYFKKLKKLRNKMLLRIENKKIYTDEDIFDIVS